MPRSLRVAKATTDSASVQWEKPESDGGSEITAYVVEKREVTKASWITVETVAKNKLETVASKLFEGNQYLFRVAAENKVGLGPFAEVTEPYTAGKGFSEFISLSCYCNRIIIDKFLLQYNNN